MMIDDEDDDDDDGCFCVRCNFYVIGLRNSVKRPKIIPNKSPQSDVTKGRLWFYVNHIILILILPAYSESGREDILIDFAQFAPSLRQLTLTKDSVRIKGKPDHGDTLKFCTMALSGKP